MASDKESPTVKDLKAVGEMLGMDTTSKSKSISKSRSPKRLKT